MELRGLVAELREMLEGRDPRSDGTFSSKEAAVVMQKAQAQVQKAARRLKTSRRMRARQG
jgi:hypothetical protein